MSAERGPSGGLNRVRRSHYQGQLYKNKRHSTELPWARVDGMRNGGGGTTGELNV